MVRFKVIKGSHVLIAVAAIVLIAVVAFIVLQGAQTLPNEQHSYAKAQTEESVKLEEAKAASAFASTYLSRAPLQVDISMDKLSEKHSPSPSVLIYHTHTHEAYEQDAENPYEAVETWRTLDDSHNVVHVGEVLANELRSRGLEVVHDKTDYEQNSLDDAYVRSLKALESLEQDFDLCIDLHRDAYTEGLKPYHAASAIQYAQLMLLIGKGDNYPVEEKPDYTGNLRFAQRLTEEMNRAIPGICRNVTVKTGRYNQHIGKRSILLEVGHNRNTMQQALNSLPCLAEAIADTLISFYK